MLWPPKKCVHDLTHAFPGRLFSVFDREVGRGTCFVSGYRFGNGHECYNQIERHVGAGKIHWITAWLPRFDLRQESDVAALPKPPEGTKKRTEPRRPDEL